MERKVRLKKVYSWIFREQKKVRLERERLWDRQDKERQYLDLSIEQAKAHGAWKKAYKPSKEVSQGRERGR